MTLTCSHAFLVLIQASHKYLWLHHKVNLIQCLNHDHNLQLYDLNLQSCPSGPDTGKPLAASQ